MSNKLPSVTSQIPRDLRAFLDRVREAFTGSGRDRFATIGDLVDGGVIDTNPDGTIRLPGAYGTPPPPTNVTATGAIQNIILEWDLPQYYGHQYAEVWRSETDTIGAAILLALTPGSIYTDAVGPAKVRYYWVRFVNVVGIKGPFQGVPGVRGETGTDVAYLLGVLTGQITESQLYAALNSRINNIEVNTTAIQNEATVRANADSSLASQINTVSAVTNSNTAAIQTEVTARTNADSALSTQITTLSSTVNNNTAAIQTEATTRANADNTLFAQYTVKVDVNGYVSGFGLASTANNATPFSEFAIRADRFYVASPSGPGITPIIPFIVNTTTQTVNGVSVPAGVYMDAAFIKNGTITNAKIGNAAIDDAKIANLSAGKITAGSISTGDYIQSTNYIAGTQGWRIHGNGFAEFGAASIRGQLTASQIDSRGLSIKDASGNIILSAGTPLTTSYISGLGTLATQNTVSTGQVTGLGTLATQNTVSTGQVTGLGTLATQNSVNWNTQISNIPAFGNFAYLNSITSANISTYIAGAAIGTAYIANAAITEALIANLAVGSAKIQDAAITNAKIGSAAVDTLKIGGNAVTVPTYGSLITGHTSNSVPVTNYGTLGTTYRVVVSATVSISGLGGAESAGTIITGYTTLYEQGGANAVIQTAIYINGNINAEAGCTLGESKTNAITGFVNLPNGTHTIDIRIRCDPNQASPTKNLVCVAGVVIISGKR